MPGRSYKSTLEYRHGFNGTEKSPEISSGHQTTLYRENDTRIARWWSIDPRQALYANMSPYNMVGNNPILLTDVNGDSIPAKFYDANGNQTNEIPQVLRKIFWNEYGVNLHYNAETQMLHGEGGLDSKSNGVKDVICFLGQTNAETPLIVGFNLGIEYTNSNGGVHGVDGGASIFNNKGGSVAAVLDLAEFDTEGSSNVYFYNSRLSKGKAIDNDLQSRLWNLARYFEHEFFGHLYFNIQTDRNPTGKLPFQTPIDVENEMFRRPLGLPIRTINASVDSETQNAKVSFASYYKDSKNRRREAISWFSATGNDRRRAVKVRKVIRFDQVSGQFMTD